MYYALRWFLALDSSLRVTQMYFYRVTDLYLPKSQARPGKLPSSDQFTSQNTDNTRRIPYEYIRVTL